MTNSLPKVSIITPVFNLIKGGREKFVKQMIESVHNQTYQNIEHIIQDGASTDGTVELLKEYEKKGWIKLYSEKDKNVHDAVNKAVEKATGKYIAIMSSDDYYKNKDIVEDVVVNYLEKEQADYSFGDEERISVKDDSFIEVCKGNAKMFEFWRGGVSFCTETVFFKKTVFEEVGCFDIKYPIVADLKWQMKIRFGDYKGVYTPRTIDVFRFGDGMSNRSSTLFLHKNEFVLICYELWSQFDDTLTPEKVECMLKYNDYSELFLMKLRRFIIEKKLKYFDYVGFNNYIEKEISKSNVKNLKYEQYISSTPIEMKIKLFNFIPLLKIKTKNNNKKFYLFNFIPIIKISKKI
ncbi:MAG: glycosyltransferase family 2 protein [Rickettsiales bacterium]|nr:glycosyltransferase family 2 protein [Rickettsiales bacterium]